MSTDLEALEAAAREANAALGNAKDAIREKENRALVGRCFKFRNSYSCPEKPSDYFWLYLKVVGVKSWSLICHEFQTDKYGAITIHFSSQKWSQLTDGYRPITAREFNGAWKRLQTKIARYRP